MRYFLHFAYKGYPFRGYQRQLKVRSVQQTIEDQISLLLRDKIIIKGCGRTDAKVSASQYFAYFDYDREWDFDLRHRLNRMTPWEITIIDCFEVEDDQSAQRDPIARTYEYYIHSHKNPFLNETSSYFDLSDCDLEVVNEVWKLVGQANDFKSFCKRPHLYKTTICDIQKCEFFVSHTNGLQLKFSITANRYLHHMIRFLVGSTIAVGKGNLSLDLFKKHLFEQEAPKQFHLAFPEGLYLAKVTYPYLDIPNEVNPFIQKCEWKLYE